jgi:FAD/FMN-containing dehydrogenase
MAQAHPRPKPRWRRWVWLAAGLGTLPVVVVAGHLGLVWWNDPCDPLPLPPPGCGDASRQSHARPAEVVAVSPVLADAESQLGALVRGAAAAGQHIAIAGARHSMGGHTLLDGAIVVDMTPLAHVRVDAASKTVTAGAGATWRQVVPRLQEHGLAVKVMQSNDDFTVGGSLAVNCHGWQQRLAPIASTVRSLRVVTAAGDTVTCTRDNEHRELFRHVLGGYGLFGIITEATLDVVDDAFYEVHTVTVAVRDYGRAFRELTCETAVGMAYGRISVAPMTFLDRASVNVLRTPATAAPKRVAAAPADGIERIVFRGTAGSGLGKQLRDWGEALFGETGGGWRSVLQAEPVAKFANRDPRRVDVLQECFVPMARLDEFVSAIRPLFREHAADLLNITVRDVQPDLDTALAYAREPVFGVVMLVHAEAGSAADERVAALTRAVIDAALAIGGTYYLPYRPHATVEQFQRGYPQATAFFAAKRRLDPHGVFANQFLTRYGR